MIDYDQIGAHVREMCQGRGETLLTVAERAGTTKSALSRRIAEALGLAFETQIGATPDE
jgi:hypothetical protein